MIEWPWYDLPPGRKSSPNYRHVGSHGHVYLWQGKDHWHRRDGHIHVYDVMRSSEVDHGFPVPGWMVAAFEAGEPIEPLLDYLLETYADEHPWLPAAVDRLLGRDA